MLGQKKVKAEITISRMRDGYSWYSGLRWWQHSKVAVWLPNEFRQVDESWKKSRIDKMIAASSSGGWYGSY